MIDAFQTHGAFSWCELHTSDLSGMKKFYGDVVGWDIEEAPMPGGTYTMIKVGGQAIGGIRNTSGEQGAGSAWVSYVTVDDVDRRTKKAQAAGGQVIVAPADAPGVGRIATIRDPAGAMLCLITYDRKE